MKANELETRYSGLLEGLTDARSVCCSEQLLDTWLERQTERRTDLRRGFERDYWKGLKWAKCLVYKKES